MSRDPINTELVERLGPTIAERYEQVRAHLDELGGRDVAILPVSKGHPVEAAIAAHDRGLATLGENYAQELVSKAQVLHDRGAMPTWHFIGQMQRNKVRLMAEHVGVWQSVDRQRVGAEIARRAPGATVFAQVNLSDDPGKAGCSFDEIGPLVEQLQELGLRVEGLMGVGTMADAAATTAGFTQLRATVDALGLAECSMGMTDDLELAVDAGTTMVRIGTAIFGPRP